MTFLLWLVVLGGAMTPIQKPAAGLPANAMTRAGWLVGCWYAHGDGVPNIQEQWMRASGDVLVGRSTTVDPGMPAAYAFLRIESAPDGTLTLIRQAAGEPPARFPLAAPTPVNELVFTNASSAEGALKRVSYGKIKGTDEQFVLKQSAEGAKALEMPMKRADRCSGS